MLFSRLIPKQTLFICVILHNSSWALLLSFAFPFKLRKAGDAASAAAAEKARRTAAAMAGSAAAGAVAGAAAAAAAAQGATQAAQKASNALGDARRSGQQAAEKAFGSLMRVGLGRKTKKDVGAVLDDDEDLQAALALSLKEYQESQAQKEKGYPDQETSEKNVSSGEDVKDAASPMCQDELHDIAENFLASSDSDDRQSVDYEEEFMESEVVDTSHARDVSSAFIDSQSQPPLGLRMLCAHVSLSKVNLVLPPSEKESKPEMFNLEVAGLNISGDTLLHLMPSEIKCLRRLGVLQGLEMNPSNSEQGSNGCLTLCSATVLFGKQQLLGVERLPKVSPWMLTLRLSSTSIARPLRHEVVVEGCVHGLLLSPDIDAVKLLQVRCASLLESFQACSDTSEKTKTKREAAVWMAKVQVQHTTIDLTLVSPAPLRPLRLSLPELQLLRSQELRLSRFSSPVPQWHVLPTSNETREPDFNVYDCLCFRSVEPEADSKSFESWESLVTERQWRRSACEGRSEGLERLLLPAHEMLALSRSKLEALESAHRWEELAERQHADSCLSIQKDTQQRLPVVQEMLNAGNIIDLEEQLEALRVDLRGLDAQRRQEEQRLKTFEKEVAIEVADFRRQKLLREQELQKQLQEEEMITAALNKLIAEQGDIIAKLQTWKGSSARGMVRLLQLATPWKRK